MNKSKLIKVLVFTMTLILLTSSLTLFNDKQPILAVEVRKYFLPLIKQQEHLLTSTSYYLTTVEDSFLFGLGCDHGIRDLMEDGAQDSVVVLDFSYPICDEDGHFGVDLFGHGPVPLSEVASGTKSFAMGYYTCSGADQVSNLVIGVGTNNKPFSCETDSQAAAHGTAWAQMVSEINQWGLEQGIIHQVQAYGASDIEVGWNTPAWSRSWIGGFESPGGNLLIHFGDASGYPYEDNPYWSCGTKSFPEWTVEDVWFVSWGSPSAIPLPLIYLTSGVHAKQWAYLSQYSVAKHGYRMDFSGVFTQSQFCDQFNWQSCDGRDNTPSQAYYQLLTELKKTPQTAQDLRWKTDIRWILPEEWSISPSRSDVDRVERDDPLLHPTQQRIAELESILEQSDISSLLRKSLETKREIYQDLALKITASKANPAPKNDPIGH